MAEELQKQELTSLNIAENQLQKLKEIFPEAFTEGNNVDWDKLRLTLGENIDTGKERFGMNWPGKADCFKTIQQPSIATLVPDREESINFDTTENLFIEGDNLEVLKLLQKSYLGKVKMIYIDPPYNTGNEFVYPDNYSENLNTYLEYSGQIDGEGRKFSTNSETDGRFHSKWMNMMYPRLFLAKNLMREDGVLFISIGQTELANLINICNEIFGEENRIGIVSRVMKSGGNSGKFFSPNIEYILVYTKNNETAQPFRDEMDDDLIKKVYTQVQKEGEKKGEKYRLMGLYQSSLTLERSRNARYYIECPDGSKAIPPEEKRWRVIESSYFDMLRDGLIEFIKTSTSPLIDENGNKSKWNVYTKIWLNDRIEEGRIPVDFINKFENRNSSKELQEIDIPFDFAKPSELISYLIKITGIKNDDIILDFFAGSATTAHSVLKINKEYDIRSKFICVQLPEPTDEKSEAYKAGYKTIAEISKERIRRAIKKTGNNETVKTVEAKKQDTKQEVLAFAEPKEEYKIEKKQQDLGFKVFKLQKSNFKIWDANIVKEPEDIQQALFEHIDHISPEAAQEAILYELLLKSGFPLATPIETIILANKNVYSVADGELLICLEKELTNEVITAMAEKQPSRVICLDEGFQDNDQLKTNAVKIMASKGVVNFRTV